MHTITTTDPQWLHLWQKTPDQSPFAHPGYLAQWEDHKTQALAAVLPQPTGSIIYPFLLRNLRKEPFWNDAANNSPTHNSPAFDITSPYGYGGPEWAPDADKPNASAEAKEINYRNFYDAFRRWANQNKVVSEFVRFCLFTNAHSAYHGTVEHNNDNIVVDLSVAPNTANTPDHAWKTFNSKVRKNVRTAIRNNLTAIHDTDAIHLNEFLQVYRHTLERRKASPFYYFSKQWFEKLCRQLHGRCSMFHVVHNNQIIASELVLCSKKRIYSFLGGTMHAYFHLRPSDFLKYTILQWGREAGYQQFVIGGGHKPHDGIFAFKKSFAPQDVIPFYTGKMIFDPEKYQTLIAADHTEIGFFPAYRSSR